jgi:hypothetical protein
MLFFLPVSGFVAFAVLPTLGAEAVGLFVVICCVVQIIRFIGNLLHCNTF